MALAETTEPMPDGSLVASISGQVDFNPANPLEIGKTNRARVFKKPLPTELGEVSYDSGTDLFTAANPLLIPGGSVPLTLGSLIGSIPQGASYDQPYYVVNVSGATFKLSKAISGAPEVFSTNGSQLRLFSYASWIDTGYDVNPDSNGIGNFEIFPAQAGLVLIRVQTYSRADISLGFNVQLTDQINVIGPVDPPLAPLGAMLSYDDVSLRLDIEPSPTLGVSRYLVTDETDRQVALIDANKLSHAESTAEAENVTRRVYAVSSNGVVSASFAEVTFERVKGGGGGWVNETGVDINANGTLTKNAAGSAWNAGAVLDQAVLTDQIQARLTVAPDRNDIRQAVGFTNIASVDNVSDLEFGLLFKEDGTVEWHYDNSASSGSLGAYAAGDEFSIVIYPPVGIGEVAKIWIHRKPFGSVRDVFLHAFPADFSRRMPMHVGVAIHTEDATSNLLPRLTGSLIPSIGEIPAAAQNITSATYNGTTGAIVSTGSGAFGTSGLSVASPEVKAGGDGGFSFVGTGYYAAGIGETDPDQTADSIPYHVRVYDDYSAEVFAGATMLATGFTASPTSIVFVGREGGIPVVRIDGVKVHSYGAAPTALKENALIFDAAFDPSILPTSIDLKAHVPKRSAVTAKPNAKIGDADAGKVPASSDSGWILTDKSDGLQYWVELDGGVFTVTPV
jgi:hypothetical protein